MRPPMKGEDTKESWCIGGAVKQKGTEAPNIEFKVEDCEECTATFSFYVVSGSNLSHSAHGGRELLEPL